MKHESNLSLKTFTETYTRLLENSSADELKAILSNMAKEVHFESREAFIRKLSPESSQTKLPLSGSPFLDEINSLKEKILAQGEKEPDWDGYADEDEDCLGPYEKFLQPLLNLFDRANKLFDEGDYKKAREAYENLFLVFEIEDAYGRGIHPEDIENHSFFKIRARYFRSLYMTEKADKRISLLLSAMETMDYVHFRNRPKLQDIIDISTSPLPEFQTFLHQWIQVVQVETKPSHDAWLREATLLLEGPSGLKALAHKERYKRPRVYVDWVQALIEGQNFTEALSALQASFKDLPNSPIRAHLADLMMICATQLKDPAIYFQGLWFSFESKPTLAKLIDLYGQEGSFKKETCLQQTVQIIQDHLRKSSVDPYRESWEYDSIEKPADVNKTLLMHAYLFLNRKDQAFQLAKGEKPSGGSQGESTHPFFIAYCLVNVTKRSLDKLPVPLKNLWKNSMQESLSCIGKHDENIADLTQRLNKIYQGLFLDSIPIEKEVIDWCLRASEKRITDIVSNQHRGAYEKAALLTVACTETLKIIEPQQASLFFNTIKNEFSRHSAFQQQLNQFKLLL